MRLDSDDICNVCNEPRGQFMNGYRGGWAHSECMMRDIERRGHQRSLTDLMCDSDAHRHAYLSIEDGNGSKLGYIHARSSLQRDGKWSPAFATLPFDMRVRIDDIPLLVDGIKQAIHAVDNWEENNK